jgi:hypothetical protein
MITDRDNEFRSTIAFYYQQELGREPDAGGLDEWLNNCRHGMTGAQLLQALHESPEGVAYRNRPVVIAPVVKPLHLQISGSNFVDQEGNRIVLNGTDQFVAYRLFLDGRLDDLNALLQESTDLGFNMWRVFMMGSVKQNSILQLSPTEPDYLVNLRPFAELLNSRGIILLATVFVDAQDVSKTATGRKALWTTVADQLRGTQTLLSGGNQYPKNGWDPTKDLTNPNMLWSRGSSTADPDPFVPKPAGASFTEFHPRRDLPASLLDSVASPVTLTLRDGISTPLIISEPLGFAEAERAGSRSADPFLAWRLGRHYATECAGAVFHSDAGMRGQLLGPVQRACAEAWQRGMRL